MWYSLINFANLLRQVSSFRIFDILWQKLTVLCNEKYKQVSYRKLETAFFEESSRSSPFAGILFLSRIENTEGKQKPTRKSFFFLCEDVYIVYHVQTDQILRFRERSSAVL